MTDRPSTVRDVQSRFAALNLCDGRLLDVLIHRAAADLDDSVILSLQLVAGAHADRWEDARLVFSGCAAVQTDLDLWNKRLCGDAIVHAEAVYNLDEISRLATDDPVRQRSQRLQYLLRFQIALVPPGGSISILARDFDLQTSGGIG